MTVPTLSQPAWILPLASDRANLALVGGKGANLTRLAQAGLMTHGAVVAREYGIPAVVGVDRATTRLHTGQRVRVDGSSGSVVMLEDGGEATLQVAQVSSR
jgi:phosphoenolpyruvate synthase/pyruvate phosphate dikinase